MLRRQLETTRDELRDERDVCLESIKKYKAEVAELSIKLDSAESRNVAISKKVRHVEGMSALHETERRKLEEELEAELKMSVGCDQDEGTDGDGKPCDFDSEELGNYFALRRQYGYLGVISYRHSPYTGIWYKSSLFVEWFYVTHIAISMHSRSCIFKMVV